MLIHRAATALVLCAVAVVGAGAARAASRVRRPAGGGGGAAGGAEVAAGGGGRARRAGDAGGRRRSHGRWRPRFAAALGPGAHPLVAAHASWFLARLLDQRGETKEAAALRASLGLLSHYFVIGPFGEGRASLNTPFPPEQETAPPVLGAHYPGKTHEVVWRGGDAAMRNGVLYLDGLLRPSDQAVAYAVTFVRSDRAQPAALRLGSPGPIKVWVNGAAVFSRDVVRPAALDQDAVGIRLGRGWNRILIKTVVTDGAWRLFARVTDGAGRPLGLRGGRGHAAAARGDWRGAGRRPHRESTRSTQLARTARAAPRARGRRGRGPTWRACSPGRRRATATTGPRRRCLRGRSSCCRGPGRSRRFASPPPRPPMTTTSAAACSSRRWTRNHRRRGARCCWRGWAWPRAPRGAMPGRWRRGARRWRSIPPAGRRRWPSPRKRRMPGCP